jgi:hypothetical protein
MLKSDLKKVMALALVVTTLFVTMPVSAADFPAAKSVIGMVSGVGPVELRGINISQEGTLFAGDRVRAGYKGYAKLLLGNGSKIELAEHTDVSLNRDEQGIQIAMNTGTVGFTARVPVRIDVTSLEITASDNSAGHVAIMNAATAGVRAVNGRITVRNKKTSESFVLTKGEERLFGLTTGSNAPPIARIASNMPIPIPAPVPQAPAGRTTGGLAMDTGAWLAVIGGAAVAGVAIWGLVVALNNNDDVSDLKSQITNLNNTIATNNAATAAALRNLANAQNIGLTVSSLQAQQNQAATLAAQAQIALTLAGNLGAAATAANLSNQANALQSQLSALMSQIQAAQARFAAGTGSAAEVTALFNQEEALRTQANSIANQVNALLNQNRNTPGVPGSSVVVVGGPNLATLSFPV